MSDIQRMITDIISEVTYTRSMIGRDKLDDRVMKAMRKVPREKFVPEALKPFAFDNGPLSIGHGQTISQPYIVALMTQCLGLKGGEKLLEVGTGSGYQAAVLAEIGGQVFSVEINERLAARSALTLRELGYDNVLVKCGDGYRGWPEEAPFDGIMVTCASPEVPPALVEQIGEGGRLVIPLGDVRTYQILTVFTKKDGKLRKRGISGVRFVPMTGEVQKKKTG